MPDRKSRSRIQKKRTRTGAGRTLSPEDLRTDPYLGLLPVDERGRPVLGGIPLLRRLGVGGIGAVYYAIHPRLEIEVAVKVLPADHLTQDPDALSRFLKEARLTASLVSEHIVRVFDVDSDLDRHFIVMEYVRGMNAQEYLERAQKKGRPALSENRALRIVLAATRGLRVAHRAGVIHRDIKPGNILIPDGKPGDAKLTDLGLGKSIEAGTSVTQTNVVIGTEGFLPPEQVLEARKVGPRADVYSMGATLYALVAGHPPIEGSGQMSVLFDTIHKKPQPVPEHISAPVRAVIERCLDKKPSNRYPDGAALLTALKSAVRER